MGSSTLLYSDLEVVSSITITKAADKVNCSLTGGNVVANFNADFTGVTFPVPVGSYVKAGNTLSYTFAGPVTIPLNSKLLKNMNIGFSVSPTSGTNFSYFNCSWKLTYSDSTFTTGNFPLTAIAANSGGAGFSIPIVNPQPLKYITSVVLTNMVCQNGTTSYLNSFTLAVSSMNGTVDRTMPVYNSTGEIVLKLARTKFTSMIAPSFQFKYISGSNDASGSYFNSVEVYTSEDNVTYTLKTTISAALNSYIYFSPVGSSSDVYLKFKFLSSYPSVTWLYTLITLSDIIVSFTIDTSVYRLINDSYSKTETDSAISTAITAIALSNMNNYYDKTTINNTLQLYRLISNSYSKSEVDGLIPSLSAYRLIADSYTKSEVDGKIPNMNNFYGKTDIDTMLNLIYSKAQIDLMLGLFYSKSQINNLFAVELSIDRIQQLENISSDELIQSLIHVIKSRF